MVSIDAVNRITGERGTKALYEAASKTCFIQFDYLDHCFHKYETYTIQDDVMDELAGLGCEIIRIKEVNRPGFEDAEYEVNFSNWRKQRLVDYGFGAGLQHPLPASYVRRVQVA